MTTAVAVATMKAAQVTAAGAGLRIVELEVPDPGPDRCASKFRLVACATAMRSSSKAVGQDGT